MDNPIQEWGNKINWEKRVKAVCKPCWELKYCPYGPLVEDFPLKMENDEKSCRIFGHDCPVFYVAEPITETKELRNISRHIPRKVQFRVLKRDNQICSTCGNPVLDADIEFDHIIPWSKGGCSDEHNVKLLCRKCNRKKGNRFEDEHLVNNFFDHFNSTKDSIPYDFVESIFEIMKYISESMDMLTEDITPKKLCNLFGRRKIKEEDELGSRLFNDIKDFLFTENKSELKQVEYNALQYRWGFITGEFKTLKETSQFVKMSLDEVYDLDFKFIERLGFHVKSTDSIKKKWMKK